MNPSIQPEHRRREREQAERQLIEQVKADYICVPGQNGSSLFDIETLAQVCHAHTRLRGYQILLADGDTLLLLGRQNDNLVALTLGVDVSPATPARMHPLLPQTLCLRFETRRTLLFRLDELAVPESCVARDVVFRSRGTEPLMFRNRFTSPLLSVTGSLPLRLPLAEINWEAAFGPRAATFRQPQRDWLGEEESVQPQLTRFGK